MQPEIEDTTHDLFQLPAAGVLSGLNNRGIGFSCFREVTISIGKPGRSIESPSRKLGIRTLRYTENNISRSVFCAYEPFMFRGISFLMVEENGKLFPFDIYLFIPYGLSLIKKVDPQRRGEGLLGSDFSYDDLKMWQYNEGMKWTLLNETELNRKECFVLEGIWYSDLKPESIEWNRQNVWIDKQTKVVVKIDFYLAESELPYRRLLIPEYLVVDELLIPAMMQIENFKTQHETTIQLKQAWHNREINRDIFDQKSLKQVRSYLSEINR